MKMTQEHFDYLKNAIDKFSADKCNLNDLAVEYENGRFPRADRCKDLQKRFCFDVLWATDLNSWVCEKLYWYLNDDHIYTALKQICPKVTRKY